MADLARLAKRLRERREAIARHWQAAIAHTSYVPLRAEELHARLAALVERVIAALLAEPVGREAAQAVGAALAELHFVHPEVLGRTQEELAAQLVAGLRAEEVAGLQPRLAAVLGALATGYAGRQRRQVLADQEAIHAAHAAARRQAEEALHTSEARFHAVFDQAAIGMGIGDMEGRILAVNRALQAMFGYSAEEFGRRRVADFTHPDDAHDVWALYQELVSGRRDAFRAEKRYFHRDGRVIWTRLTVSLVRDAGGRPRAQIAMMEDITERKLMEAQLAHQAFFDALTGLPNRALFHDRLGHALTRGARQGGRVAVLFLDLDNFKMVNDSLGHEAGDQLLAAVAGRLAACLRPGDTSARLGGDEFAILLEDVDDAGLAVAVAERVAAALLAPQAVQGTDVVLGASIGIAFSAGDEDAGALLRSADLAMYRAKRQGKGSYALYEPTLHAAAVHRLALGADLRRAIEREELALRFQPIVALATGRLVGVEALVRWWHPARGLVPPEVFIPLAEEMGQVLPLGWWVLRAACLQASVWAARCRADVAPHLSVNLAARQLQHPGLIDEVADALGAAGMAADRLTLELTESAVMQETAASLSRLEALKGLGVRLAIDDFGTGYSSLSYLQRFPVDVLKIDRAFVRSLAGGDDALVRAIVQVAHALRMEAVAEGIESADQVARLRALGCELGQGYYFGQPAEAAEIERLLTAG